MNKDFYSDDGGIEKKGKIKKQRDQDKIQWDVDHIFMPSRQKERKEKKQRGDDQYGGPVYE